MASTKPVHLPHLLALALGTAFVALSDKGGPNRSVTQSSATVSASQAATAPVQVPNCAIAAPTAEATSAAATLPATQLSATPELTATVEATQAADSPLYFISFGPTDIKFNPNAEQPVVVVIVYSLVFQNVTDQELHLERPRFQLSIDGVAWGDAASTDFQTGQLQAHGSQGIVLQTLTILARATDAQKAVLNCIKVGQPVDLFLAGTIDAGTTQQTAHSIHVTLLAKQVLIHARKS